MTRRELDSAGITDPALRAAYTHCRRLNARHGRTYFLATRLLPVERRSAVHALYGFARWADDIVDDLDGHRTSEERDRLLRRLENDLAHGLRTGGGDEPVVRAVADTADRYGIEAALFADFLVSMRSDLHVTDYPTYADLRAYMHGSAAVIGLQMLPVLGTVVPRAEAAPTRLTSGWRSSSRTSCGTWARTWTAAASTCRPTCSPPTAWTGRCWSGAAAPGAATRGSVRR